MTTNSQPNDEYPRMTPGSFVDHKDGTSTFVPEGQPLSDCHQAPVKVQTASEGTSCYICTECTEVCDQYVALAHPSTSRGYLLGYEAGKRELAKQHQTELLKARIEELQNVHGNCDAKSHAAWTDEQVHRRIAQLQAELAQPTGENSNE